MNTKSSEVILLGTFLALREYNKRATKHLVLKCDYKKRQTSFLMFVFILKQANLKTCFFRKLFITTLRLLQHQISGNGDHYLSYFSLVSFE